MHIFGQILGLKRGGGGVLSFVVCPRFFAVLNGLLYTRGCIIRLDELGQILVVRVVIRL